MCGCLLVVLLVYIGWCWCFDIYLLVDSEFCFVSVCGFFYCVVVVMSVIKLDYWSRECYRFLGVYYIVYNNG